MRCWMYEVKMKRSATANITIVLFLTICLFILAFGFQGARGIWQPDEGYYIGAAVTMLKSGDFLVPRLGEEGLEVFLEKPPLLYWGIMAGLKTFGHSEFGVRAFNATCYVLTAIVVGILSFSLFKDKITAIAASFMYATMVIPFMAADFVTPDTALTLWTTTAVLCFWKSVEPGVKRIWMWQILLCVVGGLGFLTKGTAVLIPCGGMFVFLLLRKRVVYFFGTPWALIGLGLFCMIGMGWYVYVATKFAGAGSYLFDNQIWGRLISDKYRRNPGLTGALIYLPVITLGPLPWSAILWEKRGFIKRSILQKKGWAELTQNPQTLFLLCWFCVPMLVLCLASSKLGLYTLPVFPAMAIALARLYEEKVHAALANVNNSIRTIIKPAILTAVWVLALMGTKLAIVYYPTGNDARLLWRQISQYLPKEDCEIVTVDKQAYGLLFYGAAEVENTTMDIHPYPTFSITEKFSEEIKDMGRDEHDFAFIFEKDNDVLQAEKILGKVNIPYSKKSLPFGRSLLICENCSSQI